MNELNNRYDDLAGREKVAKALLDLEASVDDASIKKIKSYAIKAGISAAITLISWFLLYLEPGPVFEILLQYALVVSIVFVFLFGGLTLVTWRRSKEAYDTDIFFTWAIRTFLIGIFFGVLGFCTASAKLSLLSFFLLFLIGPGLGITAGIISLHNKKLLGRILITIVILILSVPFIIGSRFFLVWSLPYIYTPPALAAENMAVYSEGIEFIRDHDECKKLKLDWRGCVGVPLKGESVMLSSYETERLYSKLRGIRCFRLERDSDMVLFYKEANSILPFCSPDVIDFLPERSGVLYSLNGENPNEIDSEVLNKHKPFVRIEGNWYMSRNLMLGGLRIDMPVTNPESMIDHSLRIDGLDFNRHLKTNVTATK